MKNLYLTLGTALFAFSLMAGLVFAGDSLNTPGTMSQTDGAFMTDRLLDKDLDRGAVPLRDRDRDRDKSPEGQRDHRLDRRPLDSGDLRR